ncbi:MAG: putative porin, partial [Bacteroidota bacterium]
MQRYFTFLFFMLLAATAYSQIPQKRLPDMSNRFEQNSADSLTFREEIQVKVSGKTHYTDYKVIDHENDTTFVDTTLSISKYNKFNFLRKDNIELMPMSNQGQTFNNLAYTFGKVSLYPALGERAKQFNFYEVEDIKYYQVPTPTTELLYRTGMNQGQVMEGMFTFNTSKQLNASIAYKGTRSLGHFRNILSDHSNLRMTLSYHTKNKRYFIRSHIVAQNLKNQENGGLTTESIENFESGDTNFKDRERLVTNFTDAENVLRGNRYFLDHNFKLWQQKDSVASRKLSNFKIGHTFTFERKHYEYQQDAANAYFGDAFVSKIEDRFDYTSFYNEIYADFTSPYILGNFRVKVSDLDYDYSYNSVHITENGIIPNVLSKNVLAVGATWQTDLNKFNLRAEASTNLNDDLKGSYITAAASYKVDSLTNFEARAYTNSKSPNFNFLLYQSGYKNYNWYNKFKDEQITNLYFALNSSKWFDASVDLTSIDNYAYFGIPDGAEQPMAMQSAENVNYLKVKIGKEFRFGKFGLDNTFIYQNVSSGNEVFNVPDFITRNSFYFVDRIFKGDPLHLQTGITFT